MIHRSRSANKQGSPLRDALQEAKPLFVFFLSASAVAFFILHPLDKFKSLVFLRDGLPPVQATSAPPGIVCCAYPGQVENYKQRLLDAFGGSVTLSPDPGIPDTVTMILEKPLSPAAAHLRAVTAWRQLMAMRRNYLRFKEANACVVTVCDPSGTPHVTINQSPDGP